MVLPAAHRAEPSKSAWEGEWVHLDSNNGKLFVVDLEGVDSVTNKINY